MPLKHLVSFSSESMYSLSPQRGAVLDVRDTKDIRAYTALLFCRLRCTDSLNISKMEWPTVKFFFKKYIRNIKTIVSSTYDYKCDIFRGKFSTPLRLWVSYIEQTEAARISASLIICNNGADTFTYSFGSNTLCMTDIMMPRPFSAYFQGLIWI